MGGLSNNRWIGPISIVFGSICLLVSLISFNIAIGQLDDAVTAAATYTEQVGVVDIMGVSGLIFWIVFVGAGLVAVGVGGVAQFMQVKGGGWMDIFMSVIMGAVSIVMVLVLYNLTQTFLHTAYTTVNATVNKLKFAGLLDIIGIFGIVTWSIMVLSSVSGVFGAVFGIVQKFKGGSL
jgi:hypothetical protein